MPGAGCVHASRHKNAADNVGAMKSIHFVRSKDIPSIIENYIKLMGNEDLSSSPSAAADALKTAEMHFTCNPCVQSNYPRVPILLRLSAISRMVFRSKPRSRPRHRTVYVGFAETLHFGKHRLDQTHKFFVPHDATADYLCRFIRCVMRITLRHNYNSALPMVQSFTRKSTKRCFSLLPQPDDNLLSVCTWILQADPDKERRGLVINARALGFAENITFECAESALTVSLPMCDRSTLRARGIERLQPLERFVFFTCVSSLSCGYHDMCCNPEDTRSASSLLCMCMEANKIPRAVYRIHDSSNVLAVWPCHDSPEADARARFPGKWNCCRSNTHR